MEIFHNRWPVQISPIWGKEGRRDRREKAGRSVAATRGRANVALLDDII
jgi:hypothetical protein